ncbi:SDR family NAD(P)-dependent oxidoreductase [Rathayibacter soli]|uniref:SDR family NAD(P)-dependent oxidoreductase n=1 Tax=Rathayibacter soli TaxID=3144168 RepID=UPI0027E3BF98|nr:SDR family oxidoreductase [Glaciibacter superstes]
MGNFSSKVAVVTGGASGIGNAVVARLLREGARVAVFDRDEIRPVPDASDALFGVTVDVTDQPAIVDAVAATVQRWGKIDVLVNSVGVGAAGTVLENDDVEWRRVFDINVMGTVRVIREVLPHLIAARPSSVVTVASAVALTGFPNRALYSATKGALVSLTRAMASDHLKDGVRFNSVCPGTTETPWIQRLLDAADDPVEERTRLEARQPHGRLVSADEVADAVAYLASPLAGSTTGVTLSVDSGIESLYTA